MAWDDIFTEQGYTVPGMRPNMITPEGTIMPEPQGWSGRLLRSMQVYFQQRQAEQDRFLKEQERKVDMYKTLREAGYTSEKAFDAVTKSRMPEELPTETPIKIRAEEQDIATKAAKEKESLAKVAAGIPEKTESQKLNESIGKARKGEIDWEDLKMDFPAPEAWAKIDKAQQQTEKARKMPKPLAKQPIKQIGKLHFVARSKKGFANMSTQTKIEAEKIRTYQDLMKFIENADALEQRGVDIDALQDYYSEEIQELMREGIIKAK